MFDILITGGRVIDGTGQTWFRADVGVTGDEVTVIREMRRGWRRGGLSTPQAASSAPAS